MKNVSLPLSTKFKSNYIHKNMHIFYFVFVLLPLTSSSWSYQHLLIIIVIVVRNRFVVETMILINCLRKTNLEEEDVEPRSNFRINFRRGERSWSGNLAPNVRPRPNLPRSRSRSNLDFSNISKKIPTFVHRIHNVETLYDSVPETPRLVRSGGMRRDWSLEDLPRAIGGWYRQRFGPCKLLS